MSESRHNPDQLLKATQADEENRNKGHLKIFFGYAAGVGKTYAMLEAAHMAKQQGIRYLFHCKVPSLGLCLPQPDTQNTFRKFPAKSRLQFLRYTPS